MLVEDRDKFQTVCFFGKTKLNLRIAITESWIAFRMVHNNYPKSESSLDCVNYFSIISSKF